VALGSGTRPCVRAGVELVVYSAQESVRTILVSHPSIGLGEFRRDAVHLDKWATLREHSDEAQDAAFLAGRDGGTDEDEIASILLKRVLQLGEVEDAEDMVSGSLEHQFMGSQQDGISTDVDDVAHERVGSVRSRKRCLWGR